MSSRTMNKKMLVAGWWTLGLSIFLLVFLYEVLTPYYYRYRRNQTIMNAYEDVSEMDLSDLDEEAYDRFSAYESDNLFFIISDELRDRIYMTQSKDEAWTSNTDIQNWKDQYSTEPVIFYQHDDVLRLVRLRAIVTQGTNDYYVYIKERSSSIRNYHDITMPFFFALGVVIVLLACLVMWCCYRRFRMQLEEAEHRQKEQEMKQKLRSERVERLQKDFVARMTHELKTPLAVISSQVEMLEYITDDEQKKQYVSSVQEEVDRISDMVGNMLDISVVEHQMEHMMQTELDMREIMDYIAMKYEGIIMRRKICLETFFDEGCMVCGDREYIEQAINNFMMNAVEHTPIQGSIRMTLKKEKGCVCVAVYNEGEQIPKKDQEHLWDGYYRKESTYDSATGEPHAGLGLAIVRNAVIMHGGTYGVKNMERGVEFWFLIPEKEKL